MTSEMGEMFNEIKAANKAKRRENHAKSEAEGWPSKVVGATGCTLVRKSEYHYHILDVGGYLINWWPSAGKWQWQKNSKVVHGNVDDLIGFINNRRVDNANTGTDGTSHSNDASRQQEPQGLQDVAGGSSQASAEDHGQAGGGLEVRLPEDPRLPWED